MKCRWDNDCREYVTPDGEKCRVDEYGDPTRHCASRRCSLHVGADEITCPRCIGRVRQNIRWLTNHAPLLDEAALEQGANSDAANLAGPAADVEAWTWRKVAARQGRAWHVSLIEDDDEQHPYTVLTRWELMLREDYDQPTAARLTVATAADYLDRNLHRIAQDPDQEFDLMAREVRKSREAVEAALSLRSIAERGAPCPECTSALQAVREDLVAREVPEREWPKLKAPRLQREHPHWCEDPDCERIHYSVVVNRETGELVPDTTGDRWVCPRDRERHWWSHADYEKWIEDRRAS